MYHHKNCMKLRKIEKIDLPYLYSLKQDSWWGTHSIPIVNMDDQQKWYESIPDNSLCMMVESDKSTIGYYLISEINWINRMAKISGSIYKEFRKEDIINNCCAICLDFAFEILNLHRIEAEVLESNFPAQIYEIGYMGFKVEGRRRQAVYKCGRYYDSLVLGLLREEWEKQDRVKSYHGSCNHTFDHDLADKLIDKSNKFILKENKVE